MKTLQIQASDKILVPKKGTSVKKNGITSILRGASEGRKHFSQWEADMWYPFDRIQFPSRICLVEFAIGEQQTAQKKLVLDISNIDLVLV